MRSSWSSEDDQLTGPARLTVAVRWRPGLTVRCGTRMARPGRPALGETCLAGLGAWSSGAHARSAGWVAGPRPPGANMASGAHGTAGVEEKGLLAESCGWRLRQAVGSVLQLRRWRTV